MKRHRKSLHVGIFGPGLSGKTHLAKALSASYSKDHDVRSIVLDPIDSDWGDHAFVTPDEDEFLAAVEKHERCAVFIDEASETIDREKDKTPLFTSIRHRGHRLHVIGHDGMSLLPVMRQQLQTLFLFRQNEDALRVWSRLLSEPRILEAQHLDQYEFLWCRLYESPLRCRLKR